MPQIQITLFDMDLKPANTSYKLFMIFNIFTIIYNNSNYPHMEH